MDRATEKIFLLPSSTSSMGLWIVISVMAVVLIGLLVAFIVVAKQTKASIDQANNSINTMIVQDETNLKELGLQLDSELNQEISAANVQTIKWLKQMNGQLNNRIDQVRNDDYDQNEFTLNTIDQLRQGEADFSKLSIGPASISRDPQGNLNVHSDSIFTVTSSNIEFALGSMPYVFSEDATSGNLNLRGPGQLAINGLSVGNGSGLQQQQNNSNLRIYAPSSLSFGPMNDNTLSIQSKSAIGSTNDLVSVQGDMNVTGNIVAPAIKVMQEQIADLTNKYTRAYGLASLAYNATMQEGRY
jgi:hypothetical protein